MITLWWCSCYPVLLSFHRLISFFTNGFNLNVKVISLRPPCGFTPSCSRVLSLSVSQAEDGGPAEPCAIMASQSPTKDELVKMSEEQNKLIG